MKQKLHKELQSLLDFYHKQRQNLPQAFTYGAGIINNPSFFTVGDLQRHLNNPLLQPEWVHAKLDGKRIELEKTCFYKTVQSRKLHFMDKEALSNAINKGAAIVLEGIDILEPGVNEFVARLDDSLPCVLSNAEVFFSQQDSEAYEGHCDADDVLVVQLAGKKTWQLFQPQQRRYAEIQDLNSPCARATHFMRAPAYRIAASPVRRSACTCRSIWLITLRPPLKSAGKPTTSTIMPASRPMNRRPVSSIDMSPF